MKKGIPTGKTGMPMRRYSGQLTTLFCVAGNMQVSTAQATVKVTEK